MCHNLLFQLDILNTNHQYDIIVMFHKSHARGHTWDYFGTPGLRMELLNSKAGSSLKNIFRLGMINEIANAKEDSTNSATSEINLVSLASPTATTAPLTHVNPTAPSNANSFIHSNPHNNTHPVSNTIDVVTDTYCNTH